MIAKPTFLPEPYRDFDFMRRSVYNHLFPSPQNDDELLALCQDMRDLVDQGAEVLAERDKAVTEHRRAQRHRGTVDYYAAPIAVQAIRKAEPIVAAQSFIRDFEAEKFDPLQHLFPSFSSQALGPLAEKRWSLFSRAARDVLYSGKLSVSYVSESNGICRLEDRNIWLVDAKADAALTTGKVQPPSHSDDIYVEPSLETFYPMIFEVSELIALFPPFEATEQFKQVTSKNSGSVGRPLERDQIAEIIFRLFPERFPSGYRRVGPAWVAVETEWGKAISQSTRKRARELFEKKLQEKRPA